MKPVAVIILNWNGAKLLREFLPRVIANTNAEVAEVIVADNGSDDDSVEMLAEEFPQVRVIRFDRNYGFAEGYNRAIAEVGNRYVVLLNSDVAPAPGWIEPLVAYMDTNADCGACQPKILSYRQPEYFEYAGAAGGYLDRNGYPYCRGRIFGTVERDEGQYDSVADTFWASGAALMIRTDLYRRAGGLDPKFFAHMEEIDLCWRVHRMGYRVAAVPQSMVYHLGGGSLPYDNPRKTYLNFRNNLLMLYKNLPAKTAGRRIFRRMVLDGVAGAKFALTLQWRNVAAIVRAHRDFRRMRRGYEQTADTDLIRRERNILVDYYLRGRHTYGFTKKKIETKEN